MPSDTRRADSDKPEVDEELIMNLMSGNKSSSAPETSAQSEAKKEIKVKDKIRERVPKKLDYEEMFLINRFPSGRTGKVVYIRPEYHERLLRIVQLSREDKITLYSYIDNILEHHFQEFEEDITNYYNEHYKPIF
ncbi:DUF3408 domain-containing protein [Chryseobacterium shandongense]|uniref:DUF3408 domain-containing protein n=1 Tax=Chryseobacterium shandongense TaxID=1493872 RepID=A0ABM7BAK0_9FLAO|nr:DUF3408 domain-containing protein [Chryseobacterium shandongense]AZA95653.1 DUF3408 domain-containing protein [Chryseobacterium shandongense]